MTDETLKYYDQNADAFVQGTISVIYRNVFSVHCMETAYWILAADQEGIQKNLKISIYRKNFTPSKSDFMMIAIYTEMEYICGGCNLWRRIFLQENQTFYDKTESENG